MIHDVHIDPKWAKEEWEQIELRRRRDMFAAAALTGLLAFESDSTSPSIVAGWAVMHADALLKELDK